MIPFYVYFFSKKKYEQNRSVYEEKECILRKEGLLIKSDSTSTDLKWSDLHKFKLTKEFLLFYFSKYQAITIPTRVFTQVQIRHVLKLAKVKVKNKISAIAVISVTFVILLAFLLIVGIIHQISYHVSGYDITNCNYDIFTKLVFCTYVFKPEKSTHITLRELFAMNLVTSWSSGIRRKLNFSLTTRTSPD